MRVLFISWNHDSCDKTGGTSENMAKALSIWSYVSKIPHEHFKKLYSGLPPKVRNHLGDWLENQPWEHLTGADPFCNEMANTVLTKLVEELEKGANGSGNDSHFVQWVEGFKIAVQRDPMNIIQSFKAICKGEMDIVLKQFPQLSTTITSRQEEVKYNFKSNQMQHKLKQTSVAQQTLKLAVKTLQYQELSNLQKKWIFLTEESLAQLSALQEYTVKRINIWRKQQQMAANGAYFDENLLPLQERVEFIFAIYSELHPMMLEIKTIDERWVPQDFFSKIDTGLSALVKSSFLVDKQPPQVLKTQTKFHASVSFLLGSKILTGINKMPMIRAFIITEKKAQELFVPSASSNIESQNEGASEIENGRSLFEFNQATRTCGAVFKNMLLKKIKRCERKGSESVTEEKCAILFSADIHFRGSIYTIQALSLPVVVIVHGNQDNNAKATILWDNAFSETVRRPFYVEEKVPWIRMCKTLKMKFMSEVGTKQELTADHFWFLAQKIFGDNCLSFDDQKERMVSWTQFNKEPLRERNFTFWQWFDGVVDLTKKYLKEYWSDGLIMGFVSKLYVHKLLCGEPSGTFLLRFSDSEIGGITIAYVVRGEDGTGQIQNIQPFSAKDLQILSLGDRVENLKQLTYLYKKGRKDDVFDKYYKKHSDPNNGYKRTAIVVKVLGEEDNQTPWSDSMEGIDSQQRSIGHNMHYASPTYASPVGSPISHISTQQQVFRYTPSYPSLESSSPLWIQHYGAETQIFNPAEGLHRTPDISEILEILENESNMSTMSQSNQASLNDHVPMQEDSSWTN
ncbi:signal transducer and activator of transcription 6 isoform X2 [Engystomops pustulosus]|uniref:signal transducer and activator of transcription 6 isoform X2 n=1 Tax=Engystomops pustulosus TaxID=76066 RepID=UPI003AFA7E1A